MSVYLCIDLTLIYFCCPRNFESHAEIPNGIQYECVFGENKIIIVVGIELDVSLDAQNLLIYIRINIWS